MDEDNKMIKMYEKVFRDMVYCRMEDRQTEEPDFFLTESQLQSIAHELIYKSEPMWEVINETIDHLIEKEGE